MDRHRFLAQHSLLRRLLGTYLKCDPLAISFRFGPAGKPELQLSGPPLHFNISRSAGLGLFAFTFAGPVGVDIERITPMPELEMIIQSHFTPGERSSLDRLPPNERLLAFFQAWTLKEAIVKATGVGLAGIAEVGVNISTLVLPSLTVAMRREDRLFISPLMPSAGFAGHAVSLQCPNYIHCWQI